ncbi:Enhancer of polycomb-like protein 1 [Marasmius crinis-equi]|uniref:Enhancer of polycomb-like protein n=1 Tax=Marasmius crinis-equi TaxID=585013 RepID=A0ABR3FJB3_9AGAR
MPRPGQPPASTLRNRNRINNKSRLKIVHGNIDADPIIPDEDDEKNRLLQSVAGVDQEDANEHHLQAVLSEAALRNHSTPRPTRGAEKEKEKDIATVAYIPIPEATGVADDWEQLYPSNRWKDPVSYVQFSSTTEECAAGALSGGFSYYMDERDMEWLTKNNEEARGEGTSAQGAVSCSTTRTSSRSAKAKGKEPDSPQAVSMSQDEFELVMGLYEKMTHEKTEFLHHSLETGMAFPPFNDYQDTFSLPLSPSMFTSFTLPSWLPSSAQLTRIARAVYSHWKERRLERGGHTIIPMLNFDESDTLNESYICFRRRDVKAVRKTRASQVTSSDKLARLQAEFAFPMELAKSILTREQLKRESARQSQHIWEQRIQFAELRRQYPMFADKNDEELLIDRERPSRKSDSRGVKIPPKTDTTTPQVAQPLRPRDRVAAIQSKIEGYLQKHKEVDQHWEDVVDTGYIPPPSAYQSRLFKYINPSDIPKALSPDPGEEAAQSQTSRRSRPRDSDDDSMDVDNTAEDEESDRRLKERWRFDSDDGPPYGPAGSDEQDRVLVDDFETKYLRFTVNLLADPDYACLINDPTIIRYGPDGRKEAYVPFKLGHPPRSYTVNPSQQMISQTGQQIAAASVPVSQQMKLQVQQAAANANILSQQHMRISAPGGVRRPSNANVAATVPAASSASPPRQMAPMPQPTHNGSGGRPAINMPHVDGVGPFVKTEGTALSPPNSVPSAAPAPTPQSSNPEHVDTHTSQRQHSPESARSHTPHQQQENVHGQGAVNGLTQKPHDQQQQTSYPSTVPNASSANPHLNGYPNMPSYVIPTQQQTSALSLQQVQNLKSVFAAAPPPQSGNHQLSYMHHIVPGVKANGQLPNGMINLRMPPANRQQMQWAAGAGGVQPVNGNPMQRSGSVVNGAPVNGVSAMSPQRTPSRGGVGVGSVGTNGQMNGQHQHQMSMSPPPIRSPQQQQSPPPRVPQASVMSTNSQGGY